MYQNWFDLTDGFFSHNSRHSLLLTRYQEYAASLCSMLRQSGTIWMYGESGVGKSTQVRVCHDVLPGSYYLVASTMLTPDECAQRLTGQVIGVDTVARILLSHTSQTAHIVIMIDNAHSLSTRAASWFLALQSAINQHNGTLALLFCGDSELCNHNEIDRNITCRWSMPAFTLTQCRQLLQHEAQRCGAGRSLFTHAAVKRLWKAANGKPGVLTIVTECALMSAMLRRKKNVNWWDSWRAQRDWNGVTTYSGLRIIVLLLNIILSGFAAWPYVPGIVAAYPQLELKTSHIRTSISDDAAKLSAALDNETAGMKQYIAVWGYKVSPEMATCEAVTRANLRCVHAKMTMDTLVSSGLPWMATLRFEQRVGFASVVRVDKTEVDLLTGGQTWTVTKEWLLKHWNGDALQFRLIAPSSAKSVGESSSVPDKVWLNLMLNRVIKESSSDTTSLVRAFQQSAGLYVDGIAGEKTLIKLAQRTGDAPTLLVTEGE